MSVQYTFIYTQENSTVYWLSSCLRSGGAAGAREPDARRIARALPAVRLRAARGPAAKSRLVAHWPVPARRLLRRRHWRAR